MVNFKALFLLLLLPLTLLGCGSSNTAAPPDNQAHAAEWIAFHAEAALAAGNFSDCISCHASDLQGSDNAVSCYSCHAFNTDTNFIIHPDSWSSVYADHRGYAADNGNSTCAKCHGMNLQGSTVAPSCFAGSFAGLNCHSEGPRSVPHTLTDGAFLDPATHGHVAKANLTVCQACHAQTILGVTRFNLGINKAEGTGCEAVACHGANLAHPADWPALSHFTAGNIAQACTLCHGVALDGGSAEISCLECHGVSPASNPSGCASCHNQPPDGIAPVGNISPNRQGEHARAGHSSFISATPSQTCARCHDGAGTGTANHFDGTNPADINILHPDASDTMSAVSDENNTTCNGSCHVTEPFDIIYPHANKTWY